MSGSLPVFSTLVDPADELIGWLRRQVAELAGVSAAAVAPDRPLVSLGLDSLGAVELGHRVEERSGVALSLARLLEGQTLDEVAGEVLARAAQPVAQPVAAADGGELAARGAELGEHPLSHGQRALWFLDRLAPESAAYNIAAALRLRGAVDRAALARALERLALRHPMLRCAFRDAGGEPLQEVLARRELPVGGEPAAAAMSDGELAARLEREAGRPFDLAREPLLRLALFPRDGGETVVLLAVHHIVADLWSLAVLARDLTAFYRAECGLAADAPRPLALRYTDYVRWQGKLLAGEEGERLWGYWRERLAGELPALDLPLDRPRPPQPGLHGGSRALFLDAALGAELQRLGRSAGATLFAGLLAAWAALLARHTGQEDLLVGTPTDGRDRPELAELVGYFVNPVVLRLDLSGGPSFAELLARVRRTAAEAFEHRAYPFPLLVERLRPSREADRGPVFQTLFALERSRRGPGGDAAEREAADLGAFALGEAGASAELLGMAAESLPLARRTAPFDLELVAAEAGGRIGLSLRYDADLFDGTTAARLLAGLAGLLRAAVDEPGRPLADLPAWSAAERHQVLHEWTDSAAPAGGESAIHQLFERQARRTPGAAALAAAGERLTYAELNARANRLARHLRRRGVGPEVAVAVCLERGAELVVALLAILKAGGAYVPIDPAYPEERRRFLLADSGAAVAVTREAMLPLLPPLAGSAVTAVCVDAAGEAIAGESGEDLPRGRAAGSRPSPGGLAYLIYTSGSTGRPKGVEIEHRSALALLHWARGVFPPEDLAATLAATSVCFDLSVFELFVPLSWGGSVHLVDDALALAREGAPGLTLVNTVPSAMAELVRLGAVPASVRTVNLAGEPLPGALVERIYQMGTVARVLNLYGPSEDTTYSTWAAIPRGAAAPAIGRPVAGTRAYLVDRRWLPVPRGVPGELLLAGAGLARGYHGRPELTAERFLPDPFADAPGGRLYRTGDLARHRADGELEFLGRLDHQVKLRGYRIELGEVEAALAAHPAVERAVVAPFAYGPEDVRLVAWAVPAAGGEPAGEALRDWLRERLPDFMVPAAVVTLAALPLTPNGKLDRKALPPPVRQAGAGTAPRGAIEELLAGIWAEVLGGAATWENGASATIGAIGSTDDFFALGGHSLLATQVAARVRQALGVELPLRSLFVHRTLAALAARIERGRGEAPALPPLAPQAGPPVASFAQERLWFLHRLDRESAAYNMPAAVRLRGRLAPAALAAALDEVVRRHQVLRTTFREEAGAPVPVAAERLAVELPMIDLELDLELGRAGADAEAARLTAGEARRPFDLARGPLLRARLLRLHAEEHILLLTLHHIVADGWSQAVLVREVSVLYEAFRRGAASPLPALPVQYADFARWQRGWPAEVLEAQLAYWRRQLGGDLPPLALATDRPRPARLGDRGGRRPARLPAPLAAALATLGRRQGATLYMALLAGFQALLHRHTGEVDVAVGSPIANRRHRELDGLIGFFVNTLVLRGDLAGDPSFATLLERTRGVALAAYDRQDLPFERLVDELRPRRDRSRSPLVQALLALQNVPMPSLALPGLAVTLSEVDNGTAKLDLTLSLAAGEDGLGGWLEYAADLYDPETADRLLGHLAVLLAAAAADPARPLSALPLLTPEERRELLAAGGRSRRDFPAYRLHERFAERAARVPRAVAVTCEGASLTYEELDARANRLARHLLRLGVGAERPVGLCVEPSPLLAVAILGILKAGGAYLPLDPAEPAERLGAMIEGSRMEVLLTEERRMAGLPGAAWALRVLPLDLGWPRIETESAAALAGPAGPPAGTADPLADALACVLYTCRATGDLAGTLLTHANVARLFAAAAGWLGEAAAGTQDVWALAGSPASGAALWELWGALLQGGRLAVVPPAVAQAPAAFHQLLGREGVTVLHQSPSAFRRLAAADADASGAARAALRLRRVILGGETLEPEGRAACAAWLRRHGHDGERPRLATAYGRPEAAVHASLRPLAASDLGGASRDLLGDALPGLDLRVLDGRLEPQPAGVPGEVFVGGAGLARGYLGRPDLTAERFLPDPFAAPPGGRLYRTGDLARRLADGGLERLGPAAGRVDRRPIDRPEGDLAAPAGSFAEPRDPVEERLAAIWREVLRVDAVGIHDSFFALGGHSLLATRLAARIAAAFGVELPLGALFDEPTVAQLAARIAAAAGEGRRAAAPPLRRVPRDGGLPLSFAQERLWIADRLDPGRAVYNVFHALHLSGPLDAAALGAAFAAVARRHEVLHTAFVAVRGRPLQVAVPGRAVTLGVDDLAHLAPAEQERRVRELAEEKARRPFDLAADALLRARLLALGADDHVLLLTLHHIVCDDGSIGVLLGEMAELYQAKTAGREARLPELPVQYADYAVWQREWLSGPRLAGELAYWQGHLGEDPPVLRLPTDRPRPAAQTFRGASRHFALPATLSAALRAAGAAQGNTLFLTLLAAYAAVLHRCSGQDDLVVGCAAANRQRVELEGLIGFFVNILPLRLDLSGDPTYGDLLRRVRRAALAGLDHQDVPFEQIVGAVKARRDPGHAALRQVGFAFESTARAVELAPRVLGRPLEVDAGVARLDLTLFLWDAGDAIRGMCEYATDLFDPATIDRFLGFLERVLAEMAADPSRRLAALPPLVVQQPAAPAVSSLTESQLLFWFAHQLNPEVQLYFDLATTTFSVAGEIDPEPFGRAFQKLVDRCDSLRSTIETRGGAPVRVVHERLPAPVDLVDLAAAPDPEAAYRAWLDERCRRRLDLERRLFDCALVRLGPRRTVWFWNVHHIVADAWSIAKIAETLSLYYRLSCEGRLDAAPPLASYQAYVEHERRLRESPLYERARRYWAQKLAAPLVRNAFYRREAARRSTRTARTTVELGAAASAALAAAVRRDQLFSPAVVFATAIFALLYRLGGERTLRLGTPFANRSAAFAEVVGLQMNACPLQVRVDDGETFLSLARKIQSETVETARFQFFPVKNPVQEPVYDVYFNYQNVAFTELCGLPVVFDLIQTDHSNDLFDLQVRDFTASGCFGLDFDLNLEAFDPAERRRTVGHFRRLLDAFVADGETRLDAVDLLSPAERRELLALDRTAVDYAEPRPIHELIAAQAARTPEAEAVAFAGERLSYRQLDGRANRLAHLLIELGVGPDVRVGIAVERSLEMVVGLLAILKAGGAYVPLDPGYPEERLAFMLEDSRVPVLLTQGRLKDRIADRLAGGPRVTLRLDEEQAAIDRRPESAPGVPVGDANLAYVIYTSGSTGRPKGVMVPHGGIRNRLLWMQQAYGLTGEDRVLQKTPFSFDVSVWELFWPLMTGAALVVALPGGHQDPAYLARTLAEERITTLHFVPSMLQAFLAQPQLPPCPALRRVIASGEALPEPLRRRFFERLPGAELHNLYGPTEASVDVTHWACPRESDLATVPIGRPIANTSIHLLDRAGNLTPLGIAGELLIGGVGLARGYLARPDLTAERFVPDPFGGLPSVAESAAEPGARLYRTGDLARRLPDGSLEFLGRLDQQVKLRGFRIELGEIEAAVALHPAVAEAAVAAREDRPGDHRLVAYVVAAGEPPTLGALRAFLERTLPEPMLPAALVALPALPLTPSGKLDRRALPAPDLAQQATGRPFVAPRNALEALLASIWAEVLGVERVSVLDSFFDLGGNSLSATQATTMVQEVLPVELPLRNVFEAPTVAGIAAFVERSAARLSAEERQAMAEVLADFEQMMAGDGDEPPARQPAADAAVKASTNQAE